jgi:hypothetical protein
MSHSIGSIAEGSVASAGPCFILGHAMPNVSSDNELHG